MVNDKQNVEIWRKGEKDKKKDMVTDREAWKGGQEVASYESKEVRQVTVS